MQPGAQDLRAADAQKAFHRIADQHRTGIVGVEQDAVLQIGHDLVEVLFEGREDLFHVAHAPADAFDLVRDQHHGIARCVATAASPATSASARASASSRAPICSIGLRARLARNAAKINEQTIATPV